MPQGLHPNEFIPVENRRRTYIEQGGLGNDMNGWKNPRERQQYTCVHCKKTYQWSQELDFTDDGDVIPNLCSDCRKILRGLRNNHPEIVR